VSLPADDAGAVLINVAFDRRSRRFGAGYGDFLLHMARYIERLHRRGHAVRFASHMPSDEKFLTDLEREFALKLEVEQLHSMDLEQGYQVYRDAALVVGTRGHATMIPFGLGTPVLSLMSHPKMRYFLEDIGRLEWGVELSEPDLGDVVFEKSVTILDAAARVRQEIAPLQLPLLEAVSGAAAGFLARV